MHFGIFFTGECHFACCKEAVVSFFAPATVLEVHLFWQPLLFHEQLRIINFSIKVSCTFHRDTCLNSYHKFSQIYCYLPYFSFSSACDRCRPNTDKIHYMIQKTLPIFFPISNFYFAHNTLVIGLIYVFFMVRMVSSLNFKRRGLLGFLL